MFFSLINTFGVGLLNLVLTGPSPGAFNIMTTALWLAIAAGIIAVIFGLVSRSWVLSRDPGNPRMQEISHAIQQGATASSPSSAWFSS